MKNIGYSSTINPLSLTLLAFPPRFPTEEPHIAVPHLRNLDGSIEQVKAAGWHFRAGLERLTQRLVIVVDYIGILGLFWGW